MKIKLPALLLPALCLTLASTASAAIIASESFEDYPVGPLTGLGGGTGFTGNWTAAGGNTSAQAVDTTGSSMAYTPPGGLPINGATRAFEVKLSAAPASQLCGVRTLATPLTETFYVGYLVRHHAGAAWSGANNTFSFHLGTNASQAAVLNFGLRGDAGGAGTNNEFIIRFGTAGPVAGASTGGQVESGRDYYLVARVNAAGGVFTSAQLWLNPAYDDDEVNPNGHARLTGFTSLPITHIFFRQAVLDADDVLRADEIKIGSSWIDVVPYDLGPKIPQVRVETAADGSGSVVPAQNITAGNSITLYAIARDAGGNFLSNTPAAWLLQNVTGGILSANLVPSADTKSAVFTAAATGSANVRAAAYATNLVDSGTLTVVAGPAATVRVETAPDGSGTVVPAQDIGQFFGITAYAITRDVGGNFLANVSATWSLQNKTGGVVDGDLSAMGTFASFTGNLSGTATIRATFGGLTPVESGLITVSRPITWVGGQSGNAWNFVAQNWSTGVPTAFIDQDDVTFDPTGSMNPSVNITTTVLPHSVNLTGGPYTFDGVGKISGRASLTNSSATLLTLLTTNDYSGLTVVSLNSSLQLGNGVKNGSFGTGTVRVDTGGTSPIFNRTDPVATPYVVSNTIAGLVDFIMEFKSGATKLAGPGANAHATALVRNGATLILAKDATGGAALGNATFVDPSGSVVLDIESGGKVILDSPVVDHITGAGKVIRINGTFDLNGNSEAFGVIQGNGVIDNTGPSNAVLTVNQGAAAYGQLGETFTFGGTLRNTGSALLGLTKDSTNTLVLTSANTFGGDTRIIGGGILELGNVNAIQNSTADLRSGDTGNLSFGNLTSATFGGLKANKALALANSSSAAVALTIGGNGQDNAYSGALSGPGSLTKTGNGIQSLNGANTYAGNTTVSGGTLLVNGALAAGSVTVAGPASLGGNGTIGGPVSLTGKLVPGNNGIGKLTVNNTVTLSGTTLMEISHTTAATNDNLTATAITLGGALTVTNIAGAPQPGDTFQLFSGTLSGNITIASLPALAPGLTWNTANLNTAGSITVEGSAVPPSITSISGAGGVLTFSGSGGVPGATYRLLASDNVAAPLNSWTPVSTNTFAADGKFTNSVPISLAVPRSFLTIVAP